MHIDVQGDAKPRLPCPLPPRLTKNRHFDRISRDCTQPDQRRMVAFGVAHLPHFLDRIARV